MATPAEDAVQAQDSATEQMLPVAELAIAGALAESGSSGDDDLPDVPPPPGLEEATHLVVYTILWELLRGSKEEEEPPVAPQEEEVTPAPEPTEAVVKKTADIITPEITSEAWEWALNYAKGVNSKQAIEAPDMAEQIDKAEKLLARNLGTRTAAENTLATGHLLGMPYKVWLTRGDPNVRSTHRKLHGVPVDMGKPFLRWPSGQVLDFPGDPRAPIHETANCRCFLFLAPTKERVAEALAPADLDKAFSLAASLESRWE